MIWSFLAKWAIGGGELVGVAVFSVPAQPKALDALPCDRDEAVELGRLPSGPATVLRSTAEDDDAPGLVRAHLADHPLIGGNGPTMHAAAVSVLHSLRKNAADPIGWLRACAEECAAELERIQSDEDNCEMYEAEEMWEAVERAYLNAARIVEASAAAKARTV